MRAQNHVLMGDYLVFVDDSKTHWVVIALELVAGKPDQVFFSPNGKTWQELYLAELRQHDFDDFDAVLLSAFEQRDSVVPVTCTRTRDQLWWQNRAVILHRRDEVPLVFQEVELLDGDIVMRLKDYVR